MKEMIVHRVCKYCYNYTQVVRDWLGPAPVGTIECPKCHRFGLDLRTISQIEYMEWKGEIGAGKMLREIIKSHEEEKKNERPV